jgi:hypothetical protein
VGSCGSSVAILFQEGENQEGGGFVVWFFCVLFPVLVMIPLSDQSADDYDD